jgi:hypothetical protein
MESIMAAGSIQPQQMIAQKRKLLLLAQGPDGSLGARQVGQSRVFHN